MKRRIVSSPTGPNEVNDNTQNKTYISSSVSATLGFLSQLSSAGLEKVDLNKASEKRRGGRRRCWTLLKLKLLRWKWLGMWGERGMGGLYIYYIYEIPPCPEDSWGVPFLVPGPFDPLHSRAPFFDPFSLN